MKKVFIPLLLIAMTMMTVVACSGKKESEPTVNNFRIKRGTNVSHWLSQSEERGEARKQHIKDLEKGIKKQYTPRLKKLTMRQGKLLIRLIDRQSNQTSYELVKAFLGGFRATTYQVFASMFGFSLKKHYDPEGEDALTERVIILVENGQV